MLLLLLFLLLLPFEHFPIAPSKMCLGKKYFCSENERKKFEKLQIITFGKFYQIFSSKTWRPSLSSSSTWVKITSRRRNPF